MGAWGLGWQNAFNPFNAFNMGYGVGGLNGPFGFGNGFFPGNMPIIIVNRGDLDPGATVNSSRAVRGGGYTRASSGGSNPSAPGAFRRGGSSGSGGGSSGGGSAGRTAKPRGGGGS